MFTPRLPRRLPAWFRGDRGAVCLLVLTFALLTFPVWTGRAVAQWDAETFFAPFYSLVASLARVGTLLRWNPFSNGGSPDFAEPQLGASSPVTLLCGLLLGPSPLGFHLYWLGLWLGGGLGMYVLARALAAPPWGALVSALGFTLSGFYLGHAEHTSVVYSFSFAPWTLWRVRAAMRTSRPWPACEAGALWGLAALAGNPSIHLPTLLFLGAVAPAFLPARPSGGAEWRRALRTYAVTMGLLAGVGTVVLLPAYGAFRYEVAGYSHRALPLAREAVLCQGYGPGWLTALFTPAFVPVAERLPAWADFDISMRPVYCGAPVLVLAGFAAWRRGAWREWIVLAAGLLCLGMAMGTTLPLRGWLYDLVPPTRFIRNTAMFRGFFVLAAAVLAALGAARIEALRRVPDAGSRLRLLAWVAGIGAAAGVAAYAWMEGAATDTLSAEVSRLAPWHLGLAWVGTLLVCLTAARRAGFRRFLPAALAVLTAADLAVAFQCSTKVVYAAHPPVTAGGEAAGPLDDLGVAGWDRDEDSPENRNLYVRRPAFNDYTAMINRVHEQWKADPSLCGFVTGPQRVWFAAGVPTVPATREAYDAFLRRAGALGALPVVRHERASLLQPPPA
ncbi:MAG: hypothetical protein INR65_17055, partial [Gluconacetobacter diazotrophicus]|nr:hypothetical protein [Gluconacetobacter diazotrophicus]